MESTTPIIQSFVPSQLVRWLGSRGRALDQVASDESRMVVWAADLSDFSKLTNEITDQQRAGPEIVTNLLNETFGTIIETIERHGGEVLGFGGDSVLATWSITEHRNEAEAVVQAGLCGLAVNEITPAEEGVLVRLRIGIALGTCSLMQLGGFDGHWHFAVGGTPVQRMGQASSIADPGDVILSPTAYQAAQDLVGGASLEGDFVQLTHVHGGPLLVSQASAVALPEDLADAVRSFLSPPVLARIDAGHTEWLAEFRRLSSVFINLPTLDLVGPTAHETLQEAVIATQRSLGRYEGSLTRVLADDKGVTLIAAFGLPPFAHEEDPYRAIQAAKEIQDTLRELKLEYGIGIATGRAYCGSCGSSSRRDYTTIGREVNLAARLMGAARFEILCDAATARATRRIEFHEVEPRQLKGWAQPVRAFRPLWDKAIPRDQQAADGFPHLVGREVETRQLNGLLEALVDTGVSALVLVEGEAGIGKTALIADFLHDAEDTDVRRLAGAAEPVAQSPYHVWREVIEAVLGISGVVSVERRQAIVRERLSQSPPFESREALLNAVVGLQFPESDWTRGMSGTNRRESTVELIVSLLAEAAAHERLLIALDDAHWFDSASWAVVLAVAQKVSSIMLIISTRPLVDTVAPIDDLAGIDGFVGFSLAPIGPEDSIGLACELLDAEVLAPEVATLITESAEGIPFFIRELVHSLEESDALAVDDGYVRLDRSTADLDVPHSLTSVVLSRIDRLPPRLQLTVKVASVIGKRFDADVLAAAHPDRPRTDELTDELGQLARLDLIAHATDGAYDFRHSLIRDAAYELLVFDQRRRIHADVASFIETHVSSDEEPPHSLLAHHWDRAEEPRRALPHLETAGAGALRKGAHREAIDAHERSLMLVASEPELFEDVTQLRMSQWLVDIGQAYEALGQLDDAVATLYRAFELLEVNAPISPLRRMGRLIWEMAKQAIHIALPNAIQVPDSLDERIRLAQASRVAALIGEIYYFTVDLGGFPVLNLMSINLGEKAGEPIVAGLAYSNLGYILGTLRLRRLANRYFRLTRLAGDQTLVRELGDTPDYLDLYEMAPGHLIAVSLSESVLALTFGEWDRAREIVDEGLERCAATGDAYSAGIALAVRAFGSYSTGNLDEAANDYRRLLSSAVERSNRTHEGWATSFSVPVLLAQDRLDEAEAMAAAASRILEDVDPLTVPIIHGTKSQVLARSGQTEAALGSAEAALAALDSTPIFTYLAGFSGLLDGLFELWEREAARGSERVDRLADMTAASLKAMRAFSLALPFARPKYRLYRGRAARLRGKGPRSQRLLGKGLADAVDGGFTWDAGLLHLELAQTLPHEIDARQEHLTEARRLFVEVGSTYDLGRLEAL